MTWHYSHKIAKVSLSRIRFYPWFFTQQGNFAHCPLPVVYRSLIGDGPERGLKSLRQTSSRPPAHQPIPYPARGLAQVAYWLGYIDSSPAKGHDAPAKVIMAATLHRESAGECGLCNDWRIGGADSMSALATARATLDVGFFSSRRFPNSPTSVNFL